MKTANRQYKVDILIENEGAEIVEETVRTRSLLLLYVDQGKVKVFGSVHPADLALLGLSLGPTLSVNLGEIVGKLISGNRGSKVGS